ncbi:MAG: hypothetical protein CL840_19120 [Crocinitomicaceae bacterium]|nr:hypothetical protein [Crocinitomicaceae bacterium]|tara:strand:+ start:3026 stop:6343 length:3318 start_codon:yes stop_codon:yes gene_type:complete
MKFNGILLLTLVLFLSSCFDDKKKEIVDDKKQEKKKATELFEFLPAEKTGVTFNNSFTAEAELKFYEFQYQFNGGGVGIADFNNDGKNDVFFTGNEVENKLYLNKGDLAFEDITEKSGTGLPNSWSNGVCLIDINGDGLTDIYVSKGGMKSAEEKKNAMLINNGDLTFTDKADEMGIADTGWSTQSVFFDYDNDGDLDLFVLNHPNRWEGDEKMSRDHYKRAVIGADQFYENENGKFKNVTKKVGLKLESFGGYGLGVVIGDLDQNGYTDIYVSNDYSSPDFLYMNQGDKTFKEEIKKRTNHIALYSMGNDIADFNNDGLMDIMALDMSAEDHVRTKTQMSGMNPIAFNELVDFGLPHQYMYNTLQFNNGNGTFSEIGQLAGVQSTDWSWAPLFADFDNDGHKDLLVTNGYRLDDRDNDYSRQVQKKFSNRANLTEAELMDRFKNTPSTPLPNYIYRNNGDLTFSKKTYEWGLHKKGFTQGAAFGDLDNDGDLDLVMNNMESVAWVYENKAEQLENNHLYVEFEDPDAVSSGAVVKVTTNQGIQVQQYHTTRGYISSVEPVLHFGLGKYAGKVNVEVSWLNGTVSNYESDVNKRIKVNQARNTAKAAPDNSKGFLFKDAENQLGLNFTHVENKYNDFELETLLPHGNSNMGPALAKGDLNGDGLDDVYMGGALNQRGGMFFQSQNGTFTRKFPEILEIDSKNEDVGALIYDFDGDGDNDLYVASGGNEFESGNSLFTHRLYENLGNGKFRKTNGVLPDFQISGKSVSAGDYDNDGDLDLFVGGRLVPKTYPFAPQSMLLKYENGKYSDVTSEVAPELKNPGLVTNSQWVDYDGDSDLDLIVVGEWMPIMLMNNDNGKLTWQKELNLSKEVGWWSGLAVNDFDNDGDMDFMIGNLGLNYKYKATPETPFQIWCHDFDDNGTLDIVLGYYDHGACYPVRGRQCSSEQMPFIKQKFPTYNEFAVATIQDVYGDKLDKALNYQATNFSSVYVENLGNGKFKITSLPVEAQFSMVNSIVVTDVDKDGKNEAILLGNLYSSEVETPRADASIGSLLKLNSEKKWVSIPYLKSGLYAPGDTKSALLIKNKSNDRYLVLGKNNTQPQIIGLVK